jgi:hypothetical protein
MYVSALFFSAQYVLKNEDIASGFTFIIPQSYYTRDPGYYYSLEISLASLLVARSTILIWRKKVCRWVIICMLAQGIPPGARITYRIVMSSSVLINPCIRQYVAHWGEIFYQ